jgi:hypothetical protein
VRESANDCSLASGEGYDSCGETCYPTFDENPVSSLVVHTVFPWRLKRPELEANHFHPMPSLRISGVYLLVTTRLQILVPSHGDFGIITFFSLGYIIDLLS